MPVVHPGLRPVPPGTHSRSAVGPIPALALRPKDGIGSRAGGTDAPMDLYEGNRPFFSLFSPLCFNATTFHHLADFFLGRFERYTNTLFVEFSYFESGISESGLQLQKFNFKHHLLCLSFQFISALSVWKIV